MRNLECIITFNLNEIFSVKYISSLRWDRYSVTVKSVRLSSNHKSDM